jgi:hypothetical protein
VYAPDADGDEAAASAFGAIDEPGDGIGRSVMRTACALVLELGTELCGAGADDTAADDASAEFEMAEEIATGE